MFINKGQINLAKGDIALLSYLSGDSTYRKVGGCIWDPHYWVKRRSWGEG